MSQTHTQPTGLPRWVKISGAIVLVLVLLFAVLHLSGAHGPASHMPPMEQVTQSP